MGDLTPLSPSLPAVEQGLYRVASPELRTLHGLIFGRRSEGQVDSETIKQVRALAFQIIQRHQGVQQPSRDYFRGHPDLDFYDSGFDLDPEEDEHVEVGYRGYAPDEDSFRLTVLVVGQWDDRASPLAWQEAARDIKKTIDERFQIPHLHVEIIGDCLCRGLHVAPVVGEPALEEAWKRSILPQVTDILRRHPSTADFINGIVICRLGYERREPFPKPITIFVALGQGSDEQTWTTIAFQLKQYLNDLRFPLELRIEHNSWELLAFDHRPKAGGVADNILLPYQQRVSLGAGFSANKYVKSSTPGSVKTFNPLIGTLGCYVDLKMDTHSDWRTFALTNYHVVRSMYQGFAIDEVSDVKKTKAEKNTSRGTALYIADDQGTDIHLGPSLGQNSLAHPGIPMHNRNLGNLEVRIRDAPRFPGKVEELRAIYEAKKKFFDDGQHVLGGLSAASGFRRKTATGLRLDWALLDIVPHRQGDNTLPSLEVWEAKGKLDACPPESASGGAYGRLRNPQGPSTSLRNFASGTRVWKMGALTGPTTGVYQGFRTHVDIPDSRYVGVGETHEHMFVPYVTPEGMTCGTLAVPGDSGSIAFDKDGVAVGLMFGAMSPRMAVSGKAFTLVTPIEDVFEDIKAFTGAADIRIAR